MTPEALAYLRKKDKVMGKLIKQIGPCTLDPDTKRSPFESLVRAIAHQQLHGVAAEKILGRFIDLFPGKRFPTAKNITEVDDETLRGVGFSGAKVLAIRDIAAKTLDGTVPKAGEIHLLPDEEIIERLTSIRGVGRWTVEMLLIFKLGRPDVLPVDDFGVREGYKLTYGLDEQPKPKALAAIGEKWQPYRTTAAWYLWRAADAGKKVKPKPLKTP